MTKNMTWIEVDLEMYMNNDEIKNLHIPPTKCKFRCPESTFEIRCSYKWKIKQVKNIIIHNFCRKQIIRSLKILQDLIFNLVWQCLPRFDWPLFPLEDGSSTYQYYHVLWLIYISVVPATKYTFPANFNCIYCSVFHMWVCFDLRVCWWVICDD